MQFGYFFANSVIIPQMKLNNPLGDLHPDEFLQQYWQKKPVLIKQAIKDFSSPVSAEELAGLACDESFESRIILEKDGQHPWELKTGPFKQDDFARLPATHWTLLIQDIEKHLPELSYIIEAFHFIPDWRLDDLMISYAPEHGSVGPHVDAYDVFLLQAQGKRHWKINTQIDQSADILDDTDLKILKDFSCEQEWILEPGDMLYLPPGVAHYGVALGDCITYSIGFRAPSHRQLLQHYLQTVIENIPENAFYTDPNLDRQQNPHQITEQNIERLKQTISDYLSLDKELLKYWAGTLLSESKELFQTDGIDEQTTLTEFIDQWQSKQALYRNTALKFLYIVDDISINFYIDGQVFNATTELSQQAEWLCSAVHINYPELGHIEHRDALLSLMYDLYCHGHYYF